MKIKKYDFYKFDQKYQYDFIDIRFEDSDNIPYYVTYFLKDIHSLSEARSCKNYLEKDKSAFDKVGIIQEVEVSIDRKNNLVYLSEASEDDYRFRDKNVTSQMVLQMCRDDKLEYDVMKYENFIELIDVWIAILEKNPAFVLLYQDEHDWYSLKAFAQEDAMRAFVAEHAR